VQNIHRIADLVDGVTIKAGDVVSLNQLAGPRTPERGFVPAPAVLHGTFVDEVGGGVSQFATTFYNAILLGGYEVVDHQAHFFYFKRYPMGQDATLGWPEPDLKFRNDSPSGILVDTSYTDTSVTVSFYGLTSVRVSTQTGRPFNFTPLPEKEDCKADSSLPPGQVHVVAPGGRGFDVVVKRILSYPDGRRVIKDLLTRYLPEPRAIEAASC
jgi:vancomycin resistance protein YoaR